MAHTSEDEKLAATFLNHQEISAKEAA